MKRRLLILSLFFCLAIPAAAEYTDHRNRNIDSLERVAARWTAGKDASASFEEARGLVYAYDGLMFGYRNINGERSMYFARKEYNLAKRWNWLARMADGLRGIGLIHYGMERYDSALVYLFQALEVVDRMAAGETSFTSNEHYLEDTIDDDYSGLYGSIANVYNMMDDIPTAMEYYKKAGEIFEKNGWNESNSVLWYNLGETWYEEGDFDQAEDCYEKALEYGRLAADSLQITDALKGLGGVYLKKGKTGKALRYLEEANKYYSVHSDQEFVKGMENLDFMRQVLMVQKRSRTWAAVVAAVLALLMLTIMLILQRMRRLRKEKEGADVAISEAMQGMEGVRDDDEDSVPAAVPSGGEEQFLTEREEQILPLIAAGLTSPQIADKVYLSLATIKWYRKKLLLKFDAANTAELISKAKGKGLI